MVSRPRQISKEESDMKMRVTILVPVIRHDMEGKPYKEDPADFYPHLKDDLAAIDRMLPVEAVVEKGEYVADVEDTKAIFKKFLRWKLESPPPRGFKSSGYYSKGDEESPFYSEAYLYNLLGKDDARTVLGYLHQLMEISGLDPLQVEREINAEIAAEKKAEEDRQERIAARQKFVEEYAKKKGWKTGTRVLDFDESQKVELRKALVEAGL